MTQERKVDILQGLFITALIAANLLGTKITTFWGVSVSVGIFAFPITFLVTDVIEEVLGKQKSRNLILAGFTSLLLLLALTIISRVLPPSTRYADNEAFLRIFNGSTRIILASLTAFVLSQTHDIWAFNFWRQKTKGRFLWLRNNLSTVVSQLIDTVIFMFIAFYLVTPQFDVAFLIQLIIPYWLFKVLFALIDTPLVYAGVAWLRNSVQPDNSSRNEQ